MHYINDSVFNGKSKILVNPCNCQTTLYWGTHISEYIYKNCGKIIQQERKECGFLKIGSYCITSGGKIRHEMIMHIAVMNAFSLDIRYLFGIKKRINYEVIEKALCSINNYCTDNAIDKIDVPLFWGGKNGWSDSEFERIFAKHPAIPHMYIYKIST